MHNAERTDHMALTPEAKRLRAAYMREWRAKNPGRQNEINNRVWERKAEALRQQSQAGKSKEATA